MHSLLLCSSLFSVLWSLSFGFRILDFFSYFSLNLKFLLFSFVFSCFLVSIFDFCFLPFAFCLCLLPFPSSFSRFFLFSLFSLFSLFFRFSCSVFSLFLFCLFSPFALFFLSRCFVVSVLRFRRDGTRVKWSHRHSTSKNLVTDCHAENRRRCCFAAREL